MKLNNRINNFKKKIKSLILTINKNYSYLGVIIGTTEKNNFDTNSAYEV